MTEAVWPTWWAQGDENASAMVAHTKEVLSGVVKTVHLRTKYLLRPPFAFL